MESSDLHLKINSLPNELKDEVNNFIDFLMSKKKIKKSEKKPKFGCAKGKIFISEDFDEPLDDFKEYME